MKLPLQMEYHRDESRAVQVRWKETEPFVLNERAVLIHRPRTVSTISIGRWPAHLAVHNYCGSGFAGTKNLLFVEAPPENMILCRRCEAAAVAAGLPAAEVLAGRHVHIGGVKAFADCHNVNFEVIGDE